jgi:ferredoxin-NADP reductase
MTEFVTHNVKRFVVEKPKGFKYTPGQATDLTINKEGFKDKKNPFTFTSLNNDLVLEFTIKGYPVVDYPDHEGVTEELHKLVPGDELIIEDPWGTIKYKGPGVFIAGGAGITPFIAILRQLRNDGKIKGNKLIFSNKKKEDVILEAELRNMFGKDDLILTLTEENADGYEEGRIDKQFLKRYITDSSQNFYVCGPDQMVDDLKEILGKLGAEIDSIVFEE